MREKEERNVSNLRHCKDFSVSTTTLPHDRPLLFYLCLLTLVIRRLSTFFGPWQKSSVNLATAMYSSNRYKKNCVRSNTT
jgi:hypothetical protein